MKIASLIIIIIIGALPLSAQTLAPQAGPTEKLTITPADVAGKATTNLTQKRLTPETNKATQHFKSKRIIQTVGAVYLTPGQSFTFAAGDSIVLNPGFEVDSTTKFTAEIIDLSAEATVVPVLAATSPKAPEAALENAGTLKAFTLFPNPASEQFHIQYEVSKTAVVSLALFTLEGTPVQHFVSAQKQEPGSYKLTLPVNKIPSGVYVVSLKINDQTISQRVILR